MFMHDEDKLLDVARRESAYLHDHGLFDASIALDLLVKQRAELLEALKEVNNWLVCSCIATPEDMVQSFPYMQELCESVITKAEAEE